MLKTKGFFMTVALAGAALASPAMAGDSNGNFQIKAGVTWADFDNKTNSLTLNGADISALGSAKVENTWVPTATLTYYLNKNLAVELFCCAAGTSIVGKGPVLGGLGELAHTYVFPPVLTLQYHFDGMGPFRPYVGVGAEWIHFFPKTGSNGLGGLGLAANDVKIKDVFGFALQAGIDYDLGGGWSLGVDVKKIWANDAKVTFEGVGGVPGSNIVAKHQIDPLYVTANVGYRFNLCDILGGCGGGAPLK